MNLPDKIQYLKNLIHEHLAPLINGDYVLLDLPYHKNVGDTLIWQGEEDFLKTLPYKCLYKSEIDSFSRIKKYVRPNIIILCHGGGNFGDMWTKHHFFRKKLVECFPHNRVVFFPQTIGYNSQKRLEEDSCFFSKYPNVTICTRDSVSFEVAERYFKNNPHPLVPDMAFFMDLSKYERRQFRPGSKLFIKRIDQEFNELNDYSVVPQNTHVKDWLSKRDHMLFRWENRLEYRFSFIDCLFHTNLSKWIKDLFWDRFLKDVQVQEAVNLVTSYDVIYTTRMHSVILSVLLGKEKIFFFDNNYGKISSFVKTWLSDLECVVQIKK